MDIIEDINCVLNESKRRSDLKLNSYNKRKTHKKQMAFHKCKAKNRWVFGGNRSGKTECGAVETVWRALGIHPYQKNERDTIGWVVSLSMQVQRDVAQKSVLKYLDKSKIDRIVMLSGSKDSFEYGVIDYIMVRNVFGGLSKIGFKSCEASREKFQGTSLDYVWFDEEPPYDIYAECKMRVMDRGGVIFGTMTPLKGLSWVYETIYLNKNNDKNVWYIFMEWADNPYLPKKEVDELTASMSQDELTSRRYGRFQSSSGLVYTEFDESIHVVDPFTVPLDWQDKISIDPGLSNPLSAHWYVVDFDGNVYVIAEHYEAKRDVAYHAERIKAISDSLQWHRECNGNVYGLIDSAANQRTLGSVKSVAELFYENGITVNSKVDKDVFTGINRVKAYLKNADGKSRLFIFRNCVNLIREFKCYRWGDGESPRKIDDHALDELRYYICSRPESPKTIVQKSGIQKDKERLSKRLKRLY
ncbi:MAG: terminase family protein [Clostridia bacterium]|nr:terminase family protein [Clostridia bacterium]